MSLSQFALSIGFSKSYISMIENGERSATNTLVRQIVKRHCVRWDWLTSGTGEIYDKEKAAYKVVYQKMLAVIRRYPQDCKNFKRFILDDADGQLFNMFPSLTLNKFQASDIEPVALMKKLAKLYRDVESALDAWLKSLRLVQEPDFADFYVDDKTELATIEKELLELRSLVKRSRTVVDKTNDNNELLDVPSFYLGLYKQLSYRDNLEIINLMKEKISKPLL